MAHRVSLKHALGKFFGQATSRGAEACATTVLGHRNVRIDDVNLMPGQSWKNVSNSSIRRTLVCFVHFRVFHRSPEERRRGKQ